MFVPFRNNENKCSGNTRPARVKVESYIPLEEMVQCLDNIEQQVRERYPVVVGQSGLDVINTLRRTLLNPENWGNGK